MDDRQWPIYQKNKIIWAQDPAFAASGLVRQGFSGRLGGFSQGAYGSLNVSYSTEDDLAHIQANRRALATALEFSLESWTGIRQVHGNRVIQVGKEEAGRGVLDPEQRREPADGQITNQPGVTLISQHADCVPLFFLDPVHRAIGLSHAGWKGTLLDIAGQTVLAMGRAFGTKAADLLVGIGPSAGPCHYEVDQPVIDQVRSVFDHSEPEIIKSILLPAQRQGLARLDLWQANRCLLQRQGVADKNISVAGICTICRSQEFFSHRCGAGGRQAAILGLV